MNTSTNGRYVAGQGARALGWASLGIGAAELLAPQQVEQLLGLEHRPNQQGILRTLGVRELIHGVGLLTERRPDRQLRSGIWARVAGDVLDSALLGLAATRTRRPGAFAAVAATVAVIGALDLYFAMKIDRYANR